MLQVLSSFTPYQVHAVVYKHAVFQLRDLLQIFLESTSAETYPVAYDRWCFHAVTCFKCFFFYAVLNACNSLSPSVVSVRLHSSSLVSYTLVQIHLEVVHHQLLSSVICFNCFCRYQFIHTRTFITILCFRAVIWLNESPSYPRSNTPSVHQHPVFQLCDTIQVLYHPFSEDTGIYRIPVLQCCEFLKCFCIQIAQARLRDCNYHWFSFMTWLQRISIYNGRTHSVITTILQIIGKPFLECFFVYCGSNTPSTFSPFSVSVLRQLPLLPLGTTGHHTNCLVTTSLHSREHISLLLRLRCRACISPLLRPHSKHTCPFCSG